MAEGPATQTAVEATKTTTSPGGGASAALPAVRPVEAPLLAGAEKLLGDKTHFGVSVLVTSDGWPSTLMIPDVGGIGAGSPVYITKPIRIEGKNLKAFFIAKGINLPDQLGGKPKGTGKGYLVNSAAGYKKGDTQVDVDTGTGTILKDDKISFAYVPGTYTVVSAVGADPITQISFGPGLEDDVADNAAVTVQPQGGLIEDTTISCEAFYFTTNGPLLMMFALRFNRGLIESLTNDPALGALFDVKGASVRILRCKPEAFDTLKDYVAALTS